MYLGDSLIRGIADPVSCSVLKLYIFTCGDDLCRMVDKGSIFSNFYATIDRIYADQFRIHNFDCTDIICQNTLACRNNLLFSA